MMARRYHGMWAEVKAFQQQDAGVCKASENLFLSTDGMQQNTRGN